jgi:integrase
MTLLTGTGRTREVPLSRRLRLVLRAWWIAQGQPASDELVLPGFHTANYHRRHFAHVLESAKLAGSGYTPKNLRHSFASWLLTAGVRIEYVGELLGHADGGITASKHYAKWVPRGYVEPPALSDGELVVDLIARIAEWPQSGLTSVSKAENDMVEGA